MSRVGTKLIEIPEKVTVNLKDSLVEVAGPLGNLKQEIRSEIKVEIKDQKILVKRINDSRRAKSLHGLTRTLIANMILGVTQGWEKALEIHGTGYRANLEGEDLVLSLGFSHPVKIKSQSGIKFEVKDSKKIKISGIDKVLVGNIAAKIRKIRPPDAYKGKGVRYQGEKIRLKPGKAGKAGAAGLSAGA